LDNIVPSDPNKPYEMKHVIESISDRNEFYEIAPDFAKNIIVVSVKLKAELLVLLLTSLRFSLDA